MRTINPSDLSAFLAIARHRSYRKAAVEVGLTPLALSHALRALKEWLDLRLVNRTIRSVALTEAGTQLYTLACSVSYLTVVHRFDILGDLLPELRPVG